MNITKFILLSLAIIYSNLIYSQNNNITTYDPFKPTETVTPGEASRQIKKNVIKWNLSVIPRGIFQFNYERLINSHLTLEGGFGLTYFDYMLVLGSVFSISNKDLYFPTENTTITPGLAFEFAPRIYPTVGDLEGFYLSPIGRFRYYNITALDPDNMHKGSYDYGYNVSELGFTIGFQNEGWFWDVMHDWYFGVGYRTINYKGFKENSTGTTPTPFIDKQAKAPFIFFGWKMGFAL